MDSTIPLAFISAILFFEFLWLILFWLRIIDLISPRSYLPIIYRVSYVRRFCPKFRLLTLLSLQASSNDYITSSVTLHLISFRVFNLADPLM